MRECPKCMSWWDGDTCPICEVQLMSEYSNNDGSDGVFAEPVPEPQPKFANIKVGDWVELAYGIVAQLTAPPNDNRMFASLYDVHGKWQGCVWADMSKNTHITRILSPKEVVVDFGLGIKGTVKRSGLSGLCVVTSKSGELVKWVKLSLLDHATRAIVESLLEAQEEECHK